MEERKTAVLVQQDCVAIDHLEQQLKLNPRQPEIWRQLVQVAESSGNRLNLTNVYNAFLEQYPNTVQVQVRYLKLLSNEPDSSQRVEELFQKYLRVSPCVELWNLYLDYIRHLHSGSSGYVLVQAYEFALSRIGQDKGSGVIWSDYIQLLNTATENTTKPWIDSLRKAYYQAIRIPLDNVEQLWENLHTFELSLDPAAANKTMADLLPAHNRARTVYQHLSNYLDSLYDWQPQQQLYIPSVPKFDSNERATVGKWKRYLKWEESNPLKFSECDKATLITRVMCAYRQAVVHMRYYPEIWYMAFTWAKTVSKQADAEEFLKSGLEANEASYTLTFALAETFEVKKDFVSVHATYKKLLAALQANYKSKEAALQSSKTASRVNSGDASLPRLTTPGPTCDVAEEPGSQNTAYNSSGFDSHDSPEAIDLQEQRSEYGLAWVMYMRFARRAEGFQSARQVFAEARKDKWTPWQVFDAAAMMEYHCLRGFEGKDIAARIFQKGFALFGDQTEFVQKYLGFLISVNDVKNAHAVFETAIASLSFERARPLWNQWTAYQYQYGNLETSLELEKRLEHVYSTDPSIKRLALRYRYLGVDAIANRDLGLALVQQQPQPARSGVKRGRADHDRDAEASHEGDPRSSSPSPSHKRSRVCSPVKRSGTGISRSDREGGSRSRSDDKRLLSRHIPAPRDEALHEEGRRGSRQADATRHDRGLHHVLASFLAELPVPESFDGPIFRTDDIMNLFRTIVIPTTPRDIRGKTLGLCSQRHYAKSSFADRRSPHSNVHHRHHSARR